MVAIYDLLDERSIKEGTVNIFTLLLYKTIRFDVVVRLFSTRSQKTLKWGKNISDA